MIADKNYTRGNFSIHSIQPAVLREQCIKRTMFTVKKSAFTVPQGCPLNTGVDRIVKLCFSNDPVIDISTSIFLLHYYKNLKNNRLFKLHILIFGALGIVAAINVGWFNEKALKSMHVIFQSTL